MTNKDALGEGKRSKKNVLDGSHRELHGSCYIAVVSPILLTKKSIPRDLFILS